MQQVVGCGNKQTRILQLETVNNISCVRQNAVKPFCFSLIFSIFAY